MQPSTLLSMTNEYKYNKYGPISVHFFRTLSGVYKTFRVLALVRDCVCVCVCVCAHVGFRQDVLLMISSATNIRIV